MTVSCTGITRQLEELTKLAEAVASRMRMREPRKGSLKGTMNIDDMMSEIAASLRDVINETPEEVDEAPEEFYNDIAARLVLKLQRKAITIVPVPTAAEQMESSRGKAAQRILDIFNGWLKGHPERHYITRFDTSGKFEIVLRVDGKVKGFLQGEAIQDAYGQAAQVISFNGGSIDEEKEQAQG